MNDKILNVEGKEVLIEKEYTCCISGHRKIDKVLDHKMLRTVLETFIDNKVTTFLVGMAIGFDSFCFKLLEEIRKQRKIRIIACIPCEKQDLKWNIFQKLEYKRMLSKADEKLLISKEYTPFCMQKRNMFMVDNSNYLIIYLKNENGGTKNTFDYAKKQGISIINVANYIDKK